MGLFSNKKNSTGIFIPVGNEFVEFTETTSENSINGIAAHLGYNKDQFSTYFGDFDLNYDVQNVVIEIFSCKIIFVLTKPTVTKLKKHKVDYFMRNFNFQKEFDNINITNILQNGIDNKSLTIEFLSRVLNLGISDPSGIFYSKNLDLYLSFWDGILTKFTTSDRLNEWSRHFKHLNPDLIKDIETVAKKFWGNNLDQIINEINIQAESLANIPQGVKNENIDLHKTDFGTVNYFMLLVCHYNHSINMEQFLEINHGRYKIIPSSNENKTYSLDRFLYEFLPDGTLLHYSLK